MHRLDHLFVIEHGQQGVHRHPFVRPTGLDVVSEDVLRALDGEQQLLLWPDPWSGGAHRSSRNPLKDGCRRWPLADLARYSISALRRGSTQMPLLGMRLAKG